MKFCVPAWVKIRCRLFFGSGIMSCKQKGPRGSLHHLMNMLAKLIVISE
jgi:hypothetical protein